MGVAAAPVMVAAAVAMVAAASVAAAAFVAAAAAAVEMAACLSAPAAVRFAHARTAANFPDLAYNARSSLAGSSTYAVSGEHYCYPLLWAVCTAG
jgi:hypothetical protein